MNVFDFLSGRPLLIFTRALIGPDIARNNGLVCRPGAIAFLTALWLKRRFYYDGRTIHVSLYMTYKLIVVLQCCFAS